MPEIYKHLEILRKMRDRKTASIQEGRPSEQLVCIVHREVEALNSAMTDMKELNVLRDIVKKGS